MAPPTFLAPARVDTGIYYDETLPAREAELGVDMLGLHYLAHFYAAEALYGDGHRTDPPVKWLDEIVTLMLEHYLQEAIDPAFADYGRRAEADALTRTDPRVTDLPGFDREYRRYFVTAAGGGDYAWFLARLARWAAEIRATHGFGVLRRLRDGLAEAPAPLTTSGALRLLENLEVPIPDWVGK